MAEFVQRCRVRLDRDLSLFSTSKDGTDASVCVLDVVHRVLRGLLGDTVDVEVERLIHRTCEKRVARRVHTNSLDQVVERDYDAGSLGASERFALFDEV